MTILAVFASRAQSIDYAQKLMTYGVPSETIPAPKEAGIGCGLCVRFDGKALVRAHAVLRVGKYSSFKGFYRQDFVDGRLVLYPMTSL